MEFATTACAADAPQADDSYRIESNFCRSSIVKDFLAISVAAIVGANLRYLISRLAARRTRPCLPLWNALHQHCGQLYRGLFRGLDYRARAGRSALAVAGSDRLLRIVHNFSSYAFETMSYFEQGQWALMLTNVLSNNLLCLGGAAGRDGAGAGAVNAMAPPTRNYAAEVASLHGGGHRGTVPLIGTREVAATTLRIPHPYTEQDAKDFLLLLARTSPALAGDHAAQRWPANRRHRLADDQHQHAELGYWLGVPIGEKATPPRRRGKCFATDLRI
jgi:fluoride exporter